MKFPVFPLQKTIIILGLTGVVIVAGALVFQQVLFSFFPNSSLARALRPPPATGNPYLVAPEQSPLRDIKTTKLALHESVMVDTFRVRMEMNPAPIAGQEISVRWFIEDAESGRPANPDLAMHYSAVHAYFVRTDLTSPLQHHHPGQKNQPDANLWALKTTFDYPGEWLAHMQFARGNTIYGFDTKFEVAGTPGKTFAVTDGLVSNTDEMTATIRTNSDTFTAGTPIGMDFIVERKDGQPILHTEADFVLAHNIIFVYENGETAWNVHGDRSVEMVSQKTGIIVTRDFPTEDKKFSYTFTFPAPGLWLVHFEAFSNFFPFYFTVEPQKTER